MDINDSKIVTVLCLGDIVGRGARHAIKELLPSLRADYHADLVIANGENAAGGVGLDTKTALELFNAGIDVITLGDHTWQHKDIFGFLDKNPDRCIRPANFPTSCPGRGWTRLEVKGVQVGIVNLIGRTFMQANVDCPFRTAEKILTEDLKDCPITICDMHAEATSEKLAIGRYFDGRLSLVFGTHTHVQTADETILTKGSAYISDLGMCGSIDGIIGMDADTAISRFLTSIQYGYKLAKGRIKLSGIVCSFQISDDGKSAVTQRIERLSIPYAAEE